MDSDAAISSINCPRCGLSVRLRRPLRLDRCPRCFAREGAYVALGKPQVSAQLDGVGPFGHLMVVMERRSDAVVLTLHGRLDIASERCFELALGRARAEGCRRLVIDLSALEFIDYRGLQALLRARRDSLASGHGLSLLRGPAAVQRLFEVTGLVRMFSFED